MSWRDNLECGGETGVNHPATGTAWASTWLVLKASIKSFGANRNLQTAASLGFYGFLSLMPLLLLTLVLLQRFLTTSERAATALTELLAEALPDLNLNILADLSSLSRSGALSLVGVVLLVWSMTPLSAALRIALARMFNMVPAQPFIKSKLIDFSAVLSLIALFMINIGLRVLIPATGTITPMDHAVAFLGRSVLPFVLSVIFLGLLFRTFAPVRLTWRQWLLGAMCVTMLGSLMRHVFVLFLAYNPDYGYAFGSLKALFVLVVWVYYSFAALLFGAEIMANTYRRDALLLRGLLQPEDGVTGGGSSLLKKFERTLADGEVLFRENDPGREMFVILEGNVSILKSGRELVRLPAGRYFGEMSLLNNAPRTATAMAAGPARLAVITKANFDLLVRENPALVRGLLEELARRLAATNKKIESATNT